MRKVGIPFNPGIGVDPDLTGLASTFTAKYKLEGSSDDFTAITDAFTEVYAGFYTVPLTIASPGSYLIKFESTDNRIGIHEGYIQVANTSLDDIQTTVDNAVTTINDVKTTIDGLDITEVNNIHEEVLAVQNSANNIRTLLNDTSDVALTINGDETSVLGVGETATGSTSGATGLIQKATYDDTTGNTTVVVTGVTGTFQVGETVDDGNGNTTTGTIGTVTANVVNSVLEFVEEIDSALLGGGGSLDTLIKAQKDIQHLINGDAQLEDGSACPTAGKGLTQAYNELVSTHSDITAIKALAEDATFGFSALKTTIDNAQLSIESKIDAMNDTNNSTSLISRLIAVKAVVDGNATILGDSTYGNEAIKNAIDSLSSGNTTGIDDIKNMLTDANTGLAAIKTAIMNLLGTMDTKLDTIISTQTATVATRVVL